MVILLDANILVRLANKADAQRDITLDALRSLHAGGHSTAIVPQVLYEYWVVATRPLIHNGLGMLPADVAVDLAEIRLDHLFLDDEPEICQIWQRLVTAYEVVGKRAHDARLVAAMVRHGITHVLTFNEQDFARFGEIAVIAPSAAAAFPPAGA
jgi:predicted nucleic acid-binding protein